MLRSPGSSILFLLVLSLLGFSPEVAAQSFSGRGPQATRLFDLPQGLLVFEVEHRGNEGAFSVRLMAEEGGVVEQLASGDGRFGGSRAIGIPRAGRYLLDVAATGDWTVRVRSATSEGGLAPDESPDYREGAEAGAQAGRSGGGGGGRWFAAGLLGGVLTGPLGAGVATAVAGRSDVGEWPDPPRADNASYRQGFESAYEAQVRTGRRRKALVGGMVGSAVFVAAVIALIEVSGSGGAGDESDPPPADLDWRFSVPFSFR
jgi:hypothetical protein